MTAPTSNVSSQFTGFLRTPPLWLDTSYFEFPQMMLEELSAPPEIHRELEIPSTLVMGKRVECFFHYYMEHFSREEVTAHNVQIREGKITIGELDFLLRNRQENTVAHIEVVYKFYIYDPAFDQEVHRWIGPNRKDSLVKKLSRLRDRQFPLLYRPETRHLLDRLGIDPEDVTQKVCFKANLFVPFHMLEQEFPLVNNQAIRGFWIRSGAFTPDEFGSFEFFSPKKPDWPAEPESNKTWFSFSEIREQLEELLENEKSPLIWMKLGPGHFSRFFVVWW